ncbi:hypothetical protein QA600_15440 [Natronococcus sp. A-GB1]|uniref:hypothetical protein n=1 Tax=Natronococcus sp. A-GB1 TaxID=3037648 RepID=UPI00241CED47|nr:hypothetical protein [Natronococcus sp. A-GB1]MDG5760730.1 hypothetical protein [Natronococcus sp. A-GB1]
MTTLVSGTTFIPDTGFRTPIRVFKHMKGWCQTIPRLRCRLLAEPATGYGVVNCPAEERQFISVTDLIRELVEVSSYEDETAIGNVLEP